MYCKGCGHNLLRQRAGHCPACGREFLRDDPRTVLLRPLHLSRWEAVAFWTAEAACGIATIGVVAVVAGSLPAVGTVWMCVPLLLIGVLLVRVRRHRFGLVPASVLGAGLGLLHLTILLFTVGMGVGEVGAVLLMLPVWEIALVAFAGGVLDWEGKRALR